MALVVGLCVVSAVEFYVYKAHTETEPPPAPVNPLEYFPHLRPGEVVPAFDAEKPDGVVERIAYSENGNTLLFMLSATCGTCHENLPYWNRIIREVQGEVRVLGVLLLELLLHLERVLRRGQHLFVEPLIDSTGNTEVGVQLRYLHRGQLVP